MAKSAFPFGSRELLLIAVGKVEALWHELLIKVRAAWGLEPLKKKASWGNGEITDHKTPILDKLKAMAPHELARAVIELTLWEDRSPELQARAAKDFAIDVKAIEKQVAAGKSETAPLAITGASNAAATSKKKVPAKRPTPAKKAKAAVKKKPAKSSKGK